MQKYVLMMTRAVIIFKNTCLILELQKSEGLQNEDFLSILNPSVITKKTIGGAATRREIALQLLTQE